MEVLERAWVCLYHESYAEVLEQEIYHGHRIIRDNHGTMRWEQFPDREKEIMSIFGASDLNDLFSRGATKNNPLIRELYRCIGYSLSGYWEIFYWEWNNNSADEWPAIMAKLPVDLDGL